MKIHYDTETKKVTGYTTLGEAPLPYIEIADFEFTNDLEDYEVQSGTVVHIGKSAEALAKNLNTKKTEKLAKLRSDFDSAVNALVSNIPPHEIASWRKQEEQARAWVNDNTAQTPMIDVLLTARNMGETKLELVNSIIANADAYEAVYAPLLGKYQSLNKAVNSANNTSEVEAITW